MKNVFAYRDHAADGSVFISRSPESGLAAKKKASDDEAERFMTHAALPKVLQWIVLIVFTAGLILLAVGLNVLTDEEFVGDATRPIVLTAVGGGLFAVGLIFFGISAIKKKRVMGSPAFAYYESEREKLMREMKEALSIPIDAAECDLFACQYKTVRGKQRRRPYYKNSYVACKVLAWREGDAFCVFDGDAVYKFPFENFVEVERITKGICFYGWNKQEKFNKGKYKPYKIRYNANNSMYTVKNSFRVRLFRESEEYELLVPAYENETLEKLTGKTLS
ncbi:MAG: tetraspanin family protein [Clostridia bacterium]|nr:tetraspanin family protein [Clostridia bacterium]